MSYPDMASSDIELGNKLRRPANQIAQEKHRAYKKISTALSKSA